MTTRAPMVHLVEFDGHLYIGLPSEKAAFRQEMQKIGTPFDWYSTKHYRIPVGQRQAFEDLVQKHYPNWTWQQWRWKNWDDIPPWARAGINHFADEDWARLLTPPKKGN